MAVIAITSYRDRVENPHAIVNLTYTNAVVRAGGIPLVLPVGVPTERYKEMLSKVDGVILTGGGDINPAVYGKQMDATIGGVDNMRDETDVALAKMILKMKKPVLGVCRGFQILNIVHGGTLYTDLPSQRPDGLFHPCYGDSPRDLTPHTVNIAAGSKLAGILGAGDTFVNSLHHQGVEKVGKGLKVVSVASDGLVEAIEVESLPFGIGVQWHPEALPEREDMQRIFKALIKAAGGK